MTQLCTVSGIVLGPDGEPLANQAVRFYLLGGVVGVPEGTVVPKVVEADTDESGDISVDLYTGVYRMRVVLADDVAVFSTKVNVPDAAAWPLEDLVGDAVESQVALWIVEARELDEQVSVVTITDGRALLLTDAGKMIEVNSADDEVITVPTHAAVALPVNSVVEIARYGAGSVTISASSGVTLLCPHEGRSIPRYARASLIKRSTTEWYLAGDLV